MFKINKCEFINKTFRLDKKLVESLSENSAKYNISMNSLVSQCCEYALKNIQSFNF